MLQERGADLVILDLMLPDINGFSVCEEMRHSHPVVPIIMLTARSQETDKIRGLKAGADDYVTKPFSVGELVARINAIFRRLYRSFPSTKPLPSARSWFIPAPRVGAQGKDHCAVLYEVELVRLLHERTGEPVSREEILEKIWGVSGHSQTRRWTTSWSSCARRSRKTPPVRATS